METEKARIISLVQKHLDDTLTGTDALEFRRLLREEPDRVSEAFAAILSGEGTLPGPQELPAGFRERRNRALRQILAVEKDPKKQASVPETPRIPLTGHAYRAAAALFLVFLAAAAFFLIRQKPPQSERLSVTPQTYVRHLVLDDGTTVVLQKGASLEMLTDSDDATRELALTGEAYFHVQPRFTGPPSRGRKMPFVIHTGEVRTTVLGTSFTINARPESGEITVAVAEGKVKVENKKQVLGVLTANRQLRYSLTRAESVLQPVDFAAETPWLQSGMVFDEVPLEAIVSFLEKRYGATISLANGQVRKCRIVTSFTGVETLPQVLENLCTLVGASFTRTGTNTYTLEGGSCS